MAQRIRRWWRRQSQQVGARAVALAATATIGFALLMFQLENPTNELYTTPWDALWWSLTTMTTTGYGDVVPKSFLGRVVGTMTMFSGLGLFTILTALVATAFVTESLKEARGLEAITSKGHILLLGWAWRAERVLQGLNTLYGENLPPVILVNQLSEEAVSEILQRYRDLELHYVHGDFTSELVLERANVRNAAAAIIVADSNESSQPDERTVLACLTIKHLNPDLKVTGELLDARNEPHLRRARADEVIVSGEFNSYLLAASVGPSGISEAVRHLLTVEAGTRLELVDVPSDYRGRRFGELSSHLKESLGQIAIGVVTQTRVLGLADVLSADSTAVDEFIERKFEEAGLSLDSLTQERVQVNPGDGYVLRPQDRVLVIGSGNGG